jgi:cell wall-associated NlpC family hydrolase
MQQNQTLWIALVVMLALFSSCGISRDAAESPASQRLNRAEREQYSRQLGIPLTGRENPALIRELGGWMGTPYRYGGSTRAGADCSGFVWAVYRNVYGITLSRTTEAQARETRRIRQCRLKEGDIVFFRTIGRKVSHSGIYITNGYFIHASSSRGVIINSLDEKYYSRRFIKGGRPR